MKDKGKEMAKNQKSNDETYIVDETKHSRFKSWSKNRVAKITAISVGSALAIGASFSAGVFAANTVLPGHDGKSFAGSFEREGHHDKPGHGERDGDRDGDREGQFKVDPNQPPAPAPTTTTP